MLNYIKLFDLKIPGIDELFKFKINEGLLHSVFVHMYVCITYILCKLLYVHTLV